MSNLKISVITITYNSEKTVRETFESIRRQNYPNLEYVVIDGGSKDATLDIAREYEDIITTLISEPDEGIADAMNKGIKMSTGDLIGIIHSDDALEDGALKKLNDIWDGISDVYYGDLVVMTEDWKFSHILKPSQNLDDMNYVFCISHPSTFVTKKAYEKYGTFDKELKCCMDYDLFLRYYKADAVFKYADAKLAKYREGGTNQKFRRKTIDEACYVSIRHGGNKAKANFKKYGKITKDIIRPFAAKIGIKGKRVKKT